MKTHDLQQGSPQWLAYRAQHFNASDAPAMLGCSPYKTRDQLLHELHTGVTPEVDAQTQSRFDDGHRFEALARPEAEAIIGKELYPVVGSDGELSASFDGLTMDESIGYEHKTLNDELRAAFDSIETIAPEYRDYAGARELPAHYKVQMEQQLMVSGAEYILFMASKWNGEELVDARHCRYFSNPALRAAIIEGWKQFAIDLANYVPTEAAPVVVAAPVESLPAVSVRMDGALKVIDNLDVFGEALRAYIQKIPAKPTTEQEFADCAAAVTALKRAEEALKTAEDHALASMSDVEKMRRLVADLSSIAKTTRLATEKMVEARKDQIRLEEITRGREAFVAHIAALNQRLGKAFMPVIAHDFAGAIKGKRTIESLRDGIDSHLATLKIEANRVADAIQLNLNHLSEHAAHSFLFADTANIVLKAPDDFQALVQLRIADHQAREAVRLKAEQDRIEAEVIAKLANEQAAKEKREREIAEYAAFEQAEIERMASRSTLIVEAKPEVMQPAPALSKPLPHPAPVPRAVTPPTLTLGMIAARLGFNLTAAFISSLGIEPAAAQQNAKLYHEHQFSLICNALRMHILEVSEGVVVYLDESTGAAHG